MFICMASAPSRRDSQDLELLCPCLRRELFVLPRDACGGAGIQRQAGVLFTGACLRNDLGLGKIGEARHRLG